MRACLGVLAWLMVTAVGLAQEKPAELAKKPQWQRMLTSEDAKTAAGIQKRIEESEAAGKYQDVVTLADELLRFRLQRQGEDHWESVNLKYDLATWRKIAGMTEEERLKWRAAEQGTIESIDLMSQGRYEESLRLNRAYLASCRNALGEENSNTANAYNYLAAALRVGGRYSESELIDRKALEIYYKTVGKDHPRTATTFANLAVTLDEFGLAVQAAECHRQAVDIFSRVLGEEHSDTATSYNNFAMNLARQGKTLEAETLFSKSLKIRLKAYGESHHLTAQTYYNMALYLKHRQSFDDRRALYEKSIEIYERKFGQRHPETATTYHGLAVLMHDNGKSKEAESFSKKSLEIRRDVLGENHPDTATSYNNVGYNLNAQGNAAEAAPLYRKALDIRRRVLGEDHPDTATSYSNLAFNLMELGEIEQAVASLTRGVRSFESTRLVRATGLDRGSLTAFNPRRLLAALLGEPKPRTAWEHLERTLARGLFDQQSLATCLTKDEQAAQQEARQRVAALQPRILKLVTQSQRTEAEAKELHELLSQRRTEEETVSRLAVLDSERAVETGERIQAALSADAAILYWIDVSDKSGRVQEHWSCVVRHEGEPKFVRLPGTGEKAAWTKADSQLPGQLRVALATSAPASEVESLAKKLHAQRIAPVLSHLAGVKTLHVVGTHEMAGIPIEALTADFRIDYIPSGSYLARLKPQAPTAANLFAIGDPVFPEVAAKTIAPPLPTGGILITQVVPGGAGANARLQSGDVLLKYADQELSTVDDLKAAITANEKAEKNTLTVWRDGKTDTKEVAPGKLGVVLDLEPAPQAIAARRKTNEQLAKLGRGGDWDKLPGTAAELASLQSLFPQSTVLTRKEASPTKLAELVTADKLKEYRYLHFATHGEANSVMAFQSSLILHGDEKSVARLTAREILDTWKLNAELVTLSACETAIGKDGGGDGLLGFAQAFLTAGARSVCLSLWKVDDGATALLMERFYQNLLGKRDGLAKPMAKADALRDAKQWLRNLSTEDAAERLATISQGAARGARGKNVDLKVVVSETKDAKPFAHPKYWAAFILIGDPN